MADKPSVRDATRQQQFLNVISRDEATQRFQEHLKLYPLGTELVALDAAHGRVLAKDVLAPIDVPGFDRSNVDGFAVRAADTAGATEDQSLTLVVNQESLLPGIAPSLTVEKGTATPISTGGMVPRGADAIVMIEDTHPIDTDGKLRVEITRNVAAGNMISYAGSDIALGETVLWAGDEITSREIGVMAALGMTEVDVYRKPRVAIISTGDEVVSPGVELPLGSVYDSNAAILSAAIREHGGEPIVMGRARDDLEEMQALLDKAMQYDMVLLSGGTSKGAGDLSYRLIEQLNDPGIVAHGVALKPGKPICLAVTNGKPIVILPGFPTSAIFTFHEFVTPVIRKFAGLSDERRSMITAECPIKVNSNRGRTEYSLVRLFESESGLKAFPIGKGSGSVTTFSQADGFITIPQNREILDAGESVNVTLLDENLHTSDLVIIGSHCVHLDQLVGELKRSGTSVSMMHVGSLAGLNAVKRGECDMAGIHLLDPKSGEYNTPFLTDELELIRGYQRMQCFVYRRDDERFADCQTWQEAIKVAVGDPDCWMVNRNPGSGTRILTDQLLRDFDIDPMQIPGYSMQVKSHNAVASAIQQRRVDWGMAIASVADLYELATFPIQEENYDFVIRKSDRDKPAMHSFLELLRSKYPSLAR